MKGLFVSVSLFLAQVSTNLPFSNVSNSTVVSFSHICQFINPV